MQLSCVWQSVTHSSVRCNVYAPWYCTVQVLSSCHLLGYHNTWIRYRLSVECMEREECQHSAQIINNLGQPTGNITQNPLLRFRHFGFAIVRDFTLHVIHGHSCYWGTFLKEWVEDQGQRRSAIVSDCLHVACVITFAFHQETWLQVHILPKLI